MANARPSYTRVNHAETYPAISPSRPELSMAGKVVLVTGASGGIGRETALSFARSQPKALVLLGRKSSVLAETAAAVKSCNRDVEVQTYEVDLCDSPSLRSVTAKVATSLGGIDILLHCAGHLAPVEPLLETDPTIFLEGYKTTVVGTLCIAQAVVLADRSANRQGREMTFVNLTTAGILFPPFPGMGAYVSSKMAAVKLLQSFAAENPQVRLYNVHPGFFDTAMSRQLAKTTKLPFSFDDCKYFAPPRDLTDEVVSLVSDFLVWVVSDEASFLRNKLVFAGWDVDELKERKEAIVGGAPGTGQLWLGFQGFPRYIGDNLLPGA